MLGLEYTLNNTGELSYSSGEEVEAQGHSLPSSS